MPETSPATAAALRSASTLALQMLARRRGWLAAFAVTATAVSVGAASWGTQQRKWIFQASPAPASTPEALAEVARANDMESVWIEHRSAASGRPIRLHALWAENDDPAAPVMLYLFGHSLGGAIAVQLAAQLAGAAPGEAPKGVIVEGTFTSIGDMFATLKWGWLPIARLITTRFDSLATVPRIKAPLLVVHGSEDALVPSRFGRELYERATSAKQFVLVEGGTHTNTTWRGTEQYRQALRDFFGVGAPEGG